MTQTCSRDNLKIFRRGGPPFIMIRSRRVSKNNQFTLLEFDERYSKRAQAIAKDVYRQHCHVQSDKISKKLTPTV